MATNSGLRRAGMRAILGLCVAMTAWSRAGAGLIKGDVDPNPMGDTRGGEGGGHLAIVVYYSGWQPDANGADTRSDLYADVGYNATRVPTNEGTLIQAVFSVAPGARPMNSEWTQAVTGGVGTFGTPPYLDPTVRDDDFPFYWTTADPGTAGVGIANRVAGNPFIDIPSQPDAYNGKSIALEAALVEYKNMPLHGPSGFAWGHSIEEDGATVLNSLACTNGISKLVENSASSPTSPYQPGRGQVPNGSRVVDDRLYVPEPSALALAFIGFAAGGIEAMRWARKAA